MELKEAIEVIWNNRRYDPQDQKEAVSHLNEEVAESLKALMKGDTAKAKKELEDALACLLIAYRVMEIDIEKAILRQVEQMQSSGKNEKIMIITDERVEIYSNGILKGNWSIWGPEDIEEAKKIAAEFGCVVELHLNKG